MKRYPFLAFLVVAGVLVVGSPAFAHHGGSMYDRSHTISVKGAVTGFDWSNPHVMVYADAIDSKGVMQKWSVETRGGPNVLAKAGWTMNTIKIGEQITLVGYPNKNGTPNMRLQKIIFDNGMELFPGSE